MRRFLICCLIIAFAGVAYAQVTWCVTAWVSPRYQDENVRTYATGATELYKQVNDSGWADVRIDALTACIDHIETAPSIQCTADDSLITFYIQIKRRDNLWKDCMLLRDGTMRDTTSADFLAVDAYAEPRP